MAFGLKYQSDFYNVFQKLVSVKIYKRDYEDSEVILVRTAEITIEANYKDDNTPVIGTGVKVVVIANSDDMEFLEDLLISYEKEFMCVIEYDGEIAFRGFSLCDLNERQLLPYAAIVLQFTDYLHRLSEHYPANIKDPSKSVSAMRLVTDLIDLTDLDLELYVNSTLFETSMEDGSEGIDTWLPQVFVQNFVFHTSSYEYDNMYDVINKTLQPFSGFIYYHNDKWIIERQEDITRIGNWVKYEGDAATSETSLKKEINKQNGDFEYIETSQIIEYDSGLKTLILQLRDKKLDSLVFNDYTKDMEFISFVEANFSDFPSDDLEYRAWYRHSDVEIEQVGMVFQHLSYWVRFTTNSYVKGLYYNFRIQLASSPEVVSNLLINYKQSVGALDPDWTKVYLRFLLRLYGGPYDGFWMKTGYGSALYYDGSWHYNIGPIINIYPDWYSTETYPGDPGVFLTNTAIIDVSEGDVEWSINKTFDLATSKVVLHYIGGTYTVYDNFYTFLGWEDSSGYDEILYQNFHLMILPPYYSTGNYAEGIIPTTYFGDIVVTLSPEDIDNKIEYSLNQNFVKTDTIDIYLFDLNDINYSNGLLLNDGQTFTRLWTSENSVVACPLYEVFAKGKFRKYGRTIHRLKARIRCDDILKPFTIITDDNIPSKTSSSGNMILLLNGFSWDLNNGIYDIMAEEYTEEEIIVDGVLYNEDGTAIILPPDTPTGLTVVIEGSRRTKSVYISWNPNSGVVSEYVLMRKPSYLLVTSPPGWADAYRVVYRGTEINYRDSDDYFRVYNLPPGTTITYKLYAINAGGESGFTAEVTVTW